MLREMTKTTWRATLTLLLVLSAVLSANAQSLSMDYLRYIEQWSPLAVRHQQQYGIPASITLSQGLLESCAGLSRLAQRATTISASSATKTGPATASMPTTTRRTNVSANTPTRRNRLKTTPASSSANAISRFSS